MKKMKLTVVKTAKGVQVTLATDTAKKPISIDMDAAQVRALAGLLETALDASDFEFSLEL